MSRTSNHQERRSGIVLLSIIVVIALCMTLFGLWAQAAVRDHHRIQGEAYRFEAGRLAESGVARAIVRRAADADYASETWSISAADLGGTQAGAVEITIETVGGVERIRAIAKFPADAVHQAQVTKTSELPVTSRENES
jgi:Tfp pilus assembly protein PilX